MARIERNDATVIVFPVWWWSMPAVLKGWIDRVWNHGWAYGSGTYPHARVWMVGIGGSSAEDYAKRGYDAAMRTSLEVGILRYCGVTEPRLEVFHDSIDGDESTPEILKACASSAPSSEALHLHPLGLWIASRPQFALAPDCVDIPLSES